MDFGKILDSKSYDQICMYASMQAWNYASMHVYASMQVFTYMQVCKYAQPYLSH